MNFIFFVITISKPLKHKNISAKEIFSKLIRSCSLGDICFFPGEIKVQMAPYLIPEHFWTSIFNHSHRSLFF